MFINCNCCKYLNFTEEEQQFTKEDHFCTWFNTEVHHTNINRQEYIHPCNACKGSQFRVRKLE